MNYFHYDPLEGLRRLSEQLKEISEQHKAWLQPIEEALHRYDSILQPMIEASKQLDDKFKEMTANIKIPDSLAVIGKMKSSQYVFWDYLPSSFIESALSSLDFDDFILEYESKDAFAASEKLLDDCKVHPYLQSYNVLFVQSVEAYHNGLYNVAATSLTAIIDAVLSEATKNPTHKPKERCEAILNKLMADEFVADEEFATLALFMTFNAMVNSFYKTIPFQDEEPAFLNRNWIMHGRLQRRLTRLDCVKLIRFLYAIILIDYIEAQGTVNGNEA